MLTPKVAPPVGVNTPCADCGFALGLHRRTAKGCHISMSLAPVNMAPYKVASPRKVRGR